MINLPVPLYLPKARAMMEITQDPEIGNIYMPAKEIRARRVSTSSRIMFASVLFLAGCGAQPGPSVPFQSGANLVSARAAVQSCSRYAPRGGNGAVVGSYVAGVVLGGIVVGPIVVASNQSNIRANGEARAVDRCLAKRGFVRRDLTPAEVNALNKRRGFERQSLLDHLIGGGQLETFHLG